jgi:hypothetical protein
MKISSEALGKPGATTTSADPDVLHGALMVVAAAAGLVWALARHGSSDDARSEPGPKPPPDMSKRSKSAASQADCR